VIGERTGQVEGKTVAGTVITGNDPAWRRGAARRVMGYLRPHRARLAVAAGCLLVQTVLYLSPFLVMKAAIDRLEHPHGSFSIILLWTAAGLGLILAAGLIDIVRTWLLLQITEKIVAELRGELMTALLGQSIGYFTATRGGELMSRILNDVGVVENALSENLLAFVGAAVTTLMCLIAMMVVQWRLALVTLAVFPMLAFVMRRGSKAIYRSRRTLQERIAAFTVHAQEALSLSGIMLIKSFGRERTERQRSSALSDEIRNSAVHAGMAARWVGLGLTLSQYFAPVGLLVAGGWLVSHHYATLGTVIAFVTVLAFRFGTAVAAVGNGAASLISVLPAWERIFAVLDAHVEVRDNPAARPLERPYGEVSFEGVSFRYPGQRRDALEDISLEIEPGQLVALVGPSGAGKTTLTSLIARFYDPQAGLIRVDGHDLRDVRLESIAQAVGLVLQDTYLFHGTLRENLLYAQPTADQAKLEAACRDAYLEGVVADLPDGLDTVVGERGHRLSGGEKQRVAIARVILKDSPILILDEATSHLDTASERFVQAALARLFAGRTSFVIAHRLSTVLAADLIVVLDRGRIVERGTHDELMTASGLYASLYRLQFQRGAPEPARA
jgi:ATP-binding cassette, subfamily B, bacterial